MKKSDFQLLCEWPELKILFGLAWRLFEVNLALVSSDGEQSVCYDRGKQQARFCLALQGSASGKHLCAECDQRFFRQAVAKLSPLRYRCHAGLTEFIVPVIRHGQLIALLQCGQVLDSKPSTAEWNRTREMELRLGVNPDALESLFFSNHFLSLSRQTDLMGFMAVIANYVAYSEGSHLGASDSRQEILRRIMTYIESHLEEPLPLEAIAQAVGVSSRSLSRLFKDETGMTALDFVLGRRIARACHYLIASDKTCIEIAFAVGFQSVQNFNRTFRRFKLSTPSAWRLRNAGQPEAIEDQFLTTTISKLSGK